MDTIKFFLFAIFICPALVTAQNPISPPGVYIADPAARVFKDGRLYVYGSLDESTDYYCSHNHHALSTDDMINWTLHEDIFSSKGPNDKVPYSDYVLYAPDCIYKDGKYYLYYNLPHPGLIEGVAVADGPLGEFSEGKNINLYDKEQIDPAVFIDDDGTAWYIWGQFNAKMAKLNPDMMSIDPSTIRDSVLTEKEHFFHEGGTMIKRNGIYYFIYAHLGRAHRPTSIGYSTSTSPTGPFKHGGIIVDNDHSDPEVWNNHGSLAEFNGQWYVFYHRSTHGSVMMRKACVEPIFFLEDGSIPEVEMTSQGAGPALDAGDFTEAERACLLHGNLRIEKIEDNNEALTRIKNEDRAVFKYLDFSGELSNVSVRVSPGKSESTIHLCLDSPWNKPVSEINIPAGYEEGEWITFTADVSEISGKHALWFIFSSEPEDFLSVD
ncbi:MAG: family 43 glycosylhydrolase, partial [Bacteroidales bacterium]|nr:family 43 glycosylhydrolase [Bacteroidales bacterium]